MNARCRSHSTSGFARLQGGEKMKVKCGGQQRLLMVMNSIIFLDRGD